MIMEDAYTVDELLGKAEQTKCIVLQNAEARTNT